MRKMFQEKRKAEEALNDLKRQYETEVGDLQVTIKKLKMVCTPLMVTNAWLNRPRLIFCKCSAIFEGIKQTRNLTFILLKNELHIFKSLR